MSGRPTILVVEDSEDDLFLLRRALKAAGNTADVRCVGDGKYALQYLRGEGGFADRASHPLPDAIFLDLKMPLVSGLEVLTAIRAHPVLRRLKVWVLTSSDEQRDRTSASVLGIEGYLVKPPRAAMLTAIVASLIPAASDPATWPERIE